MNSPRWYPFSLLDVMLGKAPPRWPVVIITPDTTMRCTRHKHLTSITTTKTEGITGKKAELIIIDDPHDAS